MRASEKDKARMRARWAARRADPALRAADTAASRARYAREKEIDLNGSKLAYASRVRRLERIAGRVVPAVCELCDEPYAKRMNFDHDHRTLEFRGWICWRCNTVLGRVGDSVELLEKMIVYLMRSRRPKLISNRK